MKAKKRAPKKKADLDFEIESRKGSDGHILVSEKEEIIIRLKDPTDEEHAKEVLAFLEKHVKAIEFDPEAMPPIGGRA
jgi:hypothetical protein